MGKETEDYAVARFKINACFQITGRGFIFARKIKQGNIEKGQFLDLGSLGFLKKIKIHFIEMIPKPGNNTFEEHFAFGTHQLNEEEKTFLKTQDFSNLLFDVTQDK